MPLPRSNGCRLGDLEFSLDGCWTGNRAGVPNSLRDARDKARVSALPREGDEERIGANGEGDGGKEGLPFVGADAGCPPKRSPGGFSYTGDILGSWRGRRLPAVISVKSTIAKAVRRSIVLHGGKYVGQRWEKEKIYVHAYHPRLC